MSLAAIFAEAIGLGVAHPALEPALATALARARAAWPGLPVTDEEWARHVAEQLAGAPDALGAIDAVHEDALLACACLREDPTALARFDREVLGSILDSVRRIDGAPAFVDEVKHLTRVRLLVADEGRVKRLAQYQGKGSLAGWVRVAAVRIALDLKRALRPGESDGEADLADRADVSADPELACIRMTSREEFGTAFREALGTLSSRERNLLRMSYMDGLSIDRIGAVYRVHRATAARWIARAEETLLDETRRRLMERLRITNTEFESLLGVVRSQLDVSLDKYLKKSAE